MTSEDREVRQFLKWKREQERVAAKKELAKRIEAHRGGESFRQVVNFAALRRGCRSPHKQETKQGVNR